MTTVALLDDHRVVLDALQAWFAGHDDLELAVVAASWPALVQDPRFPTDVVVMDLDLGDTTPVQPRVQALRRAGCAVLVLSAAENPAQVREAHDGGAAGFVSKSAPAVELLAAVREVARGGRSWPAAIVRRLPRPTRPQLSAQEVRALRLYASDLPLREVARHLGVTPDTAKSYLDRVRDKYEALGVHARTKLELHRRAVDDGWFDDEPGGP